ncbi:MAG: DPP IV N-terminal domain-containing protein [Terracidiphilus sp.]
MIFSTLPRSTLPRSTLPRHSFLFAAAFLLVALPLAAQAPAKPLGVEAIYAHGPLIGTQPEDLSWSPDGKRLTYMTDGMLMELDQATGRARVLVGDSKLATLAAGQDTEQDRDHRERYKMPGYQWAPDSQHLLFDRVGRLWLYDLKSGKGVQIGDSGEASGDDPEFSPDGASLSFIRNHSLVIARLKEPGLPVTVVAAAESPAILNGEVDWIYLEELDARSNTAWSPDSKQLAYMQMDESAVHEYPIPDWLPRHATVEMQRYPQPGDANPAARVGVVSGEGGQTIWMRTPIRAGQDYIPRFGWVDAKTLWIETLTRDQKHRDLYFADAGTGEAHAVLQLSDEKFFDDNYDLFVGDGKIVLTNWSDGHNHMYLYSYDAADLALERGELAGAADMAGKLQRRTQAIERGRWASRLLLRAWGQYFYRQAIVADGAADTETVRGGGEVHRLLEDADAGALPSARAGADGGEGQGRHIALCDTAAAGGRKRCGECAGDCEPLWRAGVGGCGEPLEQRFAL